MTGDEYLEILRRRWWVILIPVVVVPVIVAVTSLSIPNRYVSQTLVLVEGQKVPDSLVRPVVTEELQQRLATMQEQILSRTRLQPIIEKFGVMKGEPITMEEKVDRMRKLVAVTPVTPIRDTSRGILPGFFVAFTAPTPQLAQQVCSEITSMFMSENLKLREQRAEGTTEFITSQMDDAKRHLDEEDLKLAEFKGKYLGQLPGDEQQNLTMLTTTNSQLDAVTAMLNRAQQDKTYVQGLLQQQLTVLQTGQGSSNATAANSLTVGQQLAQAESYLVGLQARYTDDHPDVIKTKNQVATLRRMLRDAEAAEKTKRDSAKPLTDDKMSNANAYEPPNIQQLRLQLHQIEQTIREKSAEQIRLQGAVGKFQSRVQLSPVVEEEYKALTRDYQTALTFYTDLLSKKKQSEMATDLERKQQGEQFRVMDPPNLPEKPSYPNRPMLAGEGLAGGLAFGIAIAGLLEMRDKSIRNERDVEFWLKLPTLGTMPSLVSKSKQRELAGDSGQPVLADHGRAVGA